MNITMKGIMLMLGLCSCTLAGILPDIKSNLAETATDSEQEVMLQAFGQLSLQMTSHFKRIEHELAEIKERQVRVKKQFMVFKRHHGLTWEGAKSMKKLKGKFAWEDGRVNENEDWADDEPAKNGNCVHLDGSAPYQWKAADCNKRMQHVLCERWF